MTKSIYREYYKVHFDGYTDCAECEQFADALARMDELKQKTDSECHIYMHTFKRVFVDGRMMCETTTVNFMV